MSAACWKVIDEGIVRRSWSREDWRARMRAGERIDPQLLWADLTGFADLGVSAPDWVPVALELVVGALEFHAVAAKSPTVILVPGLYGPGRGTRLEEARFCTALVTREFFARLGLPGDPLGSCVERCELGVPFAGVDEPALGENKIDFIQYPTTPKCVAGVVDHGIAFAHARFRRPGTRSTRIVFLWNQDIAVLPSRVPATANTVSGAEYGRELTSTAIDRHLATCDEELVYRDTRHEGVGHRLGHGTHVLDLLCGADETEPAMAEVPIVAVQLPWSTTQDTSGGSLTVHALNGLRHIIDRADMIARESLGETEVLPVVVNMSYGTLAGPHDGTSLLEQAIDEIVRMRSATGATVDVVLPAGNSYLSRCHVSATVDARKALQLPAWRILPDDQTPSFLQLWLPAGTADVEIEVEAPGGGRSGPVGMRDAKAWVCGEEVIGMVAVLDRNARGARPMAFVAVAPTASDGDRAVAPCGDWRITVRNKGQRPLVCEAWIQRDDRLPGTRLRGRQSRFEDRAYERFEHPSGRIRVDDGVSVVRRAGTLNAMATGLAPVVVGGYRASDASVGVYSAGGPTAGRSGPDVLAVSDDSVGCPGVLAAGTRSGSVVAMRGTSVAAPRVGRELILDHVRRASAGGASAPAAGGVMTGGRLRAALLVRARAAQSPTKRAVAPVAHGRMGDGGFPGLPGRVRRREPD